MINRDGSLKDIKALEDEEDKDDTPVSIEEITKKEDEIDESQYEDVRPDEEYEEDFDDGLDDEEPTDDELEYEEEYGLDDNYTDDYERGEE